MRRDMSIASPTQQALWWAPLVLHSDKHPTVTTLSMASLRAVVIKIQEASRSSNTLYFTNQFN